MPGEENRPSGRMVPPEALQVMAAPTLSPALLRPCARNWISWLVSMVTLLGFTCTATGVRLRVLPSAPAVVSEEVPSGAVAFSPLHAARTTKTGRMRNCRETASLRASLKVYVIGLPFHRSPCMKSQPFPSIPRHPWAIGTLDRRQPTFNDQVMNSVLLPHVR